MSKPERRWLLSGCGLLLTSGCALVQALSLWQPEAVAGVRCPDARICLDAPDRLDQARQLYRQALADVNRLPWPIQTPPRVIFCSTEACFQAFGYTGAAGATVGTWGIVIGPRGWQNFYLRHEMIHHLQAERLGWPQQLQTPAWFREGMAYALSDDPRSELKPPFEADRRRFRAWYASVDATRFWQAAAALR